MISLQYKNSLEAWEDINEKFILASWVLFSEGKGYISGKALYTYDVIIDIENPRMPKDFNFGRYFNYTKNKWVSLVKNYIDKYKLEDVKAEIRNLEYKRAKVYNVAFQFNNNHGHGKTCLLSAVFSRRKDKELPQMKVFIRASEVTKRLAFDLLLLQRIGKYIFEGKFNLQIHFNQMFNDDNVLIMYNAHKPLKEVLKNIKLGNEIQRSYQKRYHEWTKLLDKFNSYKALEDVKYKVHRRALKVLRPDLTNGVYPKLLARDCKLEGIHR